MNALRSRLYDCGILHVRKSPKPHRFSYRDFSFCLDLDEVEKISSSSFLFGSGRMKCFRFVPSDSIFGIGKKTATELKEAVIEFAKRMGVTESISRIELVGHMRTLGYSFNPAAFYYGYSADDRLLFGIVEVTNTFYEKKAYFVPAPNSDEATGSEPKLFYVSPFIDLDTRFEFRLKRPGDHLFVQIDSKKEDSTLVLHALLKGQARPLSGMRLFYLLFRFPVATFAVMMKIHFQAARLYLKRIPFIKKSDHPELQKRGLP